MALGMISEVPQFRDYSGNIRQEREIIAKTSVINGPIQCDGTRKITPFGTKNLAVSLNSSDPQRCLSTVLDPFLEGTKGTGIAHPLGSGCLAGDGAALCSCFGWLRFGS
jgi:hypothetical protein